MGTLDYGVSPRLNALKADAESGFLTSHRSDALTVETKLEFLEHYRRNGNITQSAELVGVTPLSIRIHMRKDENFKAEIDEARQELCDKAEGHIVEFMARPQNVVDRLAWLRSYRPEIWNPQPNMHGGTVNIQFNLVDSARQIVGEARGMADRKPLTQLNNVNECKDAELTQLNKSDLHSPVKITPVPPPLQLHEPSTTREKQKGPQ